MFVITNVNFESYYAFGNKARWLTLPNNFTKLPEQLIAGWRYLGMNTAKGGCRYGTPAKRWNSRIRYTVLDLPNLILPNVSQSARLGALL